MWLARVQARPLPVWQGNHVEHLVILAHDSGIGDVLMFARYVLLARERCLRLSFVVPAGLEAIAKRCLPANDIVCQGQEWPLLEIADAFVLLGPIYLPGALGATYASPWPISPIEGSVPLLGPGLHVGLRWAASASRWGQRQVSLASLEPLRELLPGATFHSLQVGWSMDRAGVAYAPHREGAWLQHHDLRTWDDSASLIAALNAVISVDTSIAHLAGNMGKPTHVILTPEHEDWRWGTDSTTPWYPSAKIYRGEVDESVKRIGERLASEALQAAA
jgi:hypothetical protein